jgi:transglutaminase-like putative cysteine protease
VTVRGFWRVLTLALFVTVAGCAGSTTPTSSPAANLFDLEPPFAEPTSSSPTSTGISYGDPRTYQVDYQIAIHSSGLNVDRLLLYVPKPVEWDEQTAVSVQVNPANAREGVDPTTGSGMYSWETRGSPRAGQTVTFSIEFTLTAAEIRTVIYPADVKPYDTGDALYRRYTAPEQYVESTDSKIVGLEKSIAGDEANPLVLARKFYDYVIQVATYRAEDRTDWGALQLLNTGWGQCADYSALFIALSRAAAIPARAVVGHWAESGDKYHVWAEFYLEGYGWVPVDPTVGQGDTAHRDYYFGNMDNRRVILHKGFNIPLVPASPDNTVAPFLQTYYWWYWGTGSGNLTLDLVPWNVVSV